MRTPARRRPAVTGPERYAVAVDRELRDVPRRTRRRLVGDLREHLAEYRGEGDLAARLGSPADYAAELRRSTDLPDRRGRAWRRVPLWVRILTPVVAVVVTAALVFVRTPIVTAPLATGYSWAEPGSIVQPAEVADSVTVLLSYQHGQAYDFAMQVLNDGHFAVTVDRVDIGHTLFGLLQVEDVRLARVGEVGLTSAVEPFHSFRLDPGQWRGVYFRAVFAFCDVSAAGYAYGFDRVAVHFHVLGLAQVQEVRLPQPIEVGDPGPGSPRCPVPQGGSADASGFDPDVALFLLSVSDFSVWAVANVTPAADPIQGFRTGCTGSVPAGLRAVPMYVNVAGDRSEDAGRELDLRLSIRESGRSVLVEDPRDGRCRAATPLHVVAGDRDSPTIVRGVAYVDPTTCPVQTMRVDVRQADGTYAERGRLRLYVPCGARR